MALQPPSCSTEGADLTVDFRPLECDIDAVTICPPVSGVFQVEVVNAQGETSGTATEPTLESLRANFATYRTNFEGRDLATDTGLIAVRDRLPPALDVDGGIKVHLQNIDGGGLTDVQLRATPIPVSGTVAVTEPVSIDDNGGSLTVDGTFWQATQPVSGPLTDAELRATPVPVTFPAGESGLTDVELRATPVPVSGTVAVTEPVSIDDNGGSITVDGPATDAQLRATPLPISGTVTANLGTIDGAATEASLAHTKHKFQPGVRTTVASSIASVGNNTILTPAAGKKLRVFWIGMSTSQDNEGDNIVTVKFGPSGTPKYIWAMGNPGAFSHWEPIEGAVDEALVVELTTIEDVKFNVTYEEV